MILGVYMKRKNSKREQTKLKRELFDESSNSKFWIIGIVIGTIVVFYIISMIIGGNFNLGGDKKTTPAEIQYQNIIAGTAFNQSPSEYYVLFYNTNGDDANAITSLLSNYQYSLNYIPYYIVDLNDGFNKSYISKTSNNAATKASELKIRGTTLMKISNGQNVSYVEGLEAIQTILK